MNTEDKITLDQYIEARQTELKDFKAFCKSSGIDNLTVEQWRDKEKTIDYCFWCTVCGKWRTQGCFSRRCSPVWR